MSICAGGSARASSPTKGASTRAATGRPNILLIIADDQTGATFNRSLMPNVFSQLVDQGVLLDRAYVNTSLCCPSRAQILTGLYEHDTNVAANSASLNRPTIVQAAHDDGYRTLLAGKYLNSELCTDVLREFDEWYCYGRGRSSAKDPVVDVNGTETPFIGYSADIFAGFVEHFVATTPADRPFFAIYAPKIPHLPANDDRFNDLPVPAHRPPSFDEDTTADNKPLYMQRGPLTAHEITRIDRNYTSMYRSSRGLDNAVGSILGSLGNRADNTIVFYISDNGFLYGEHRMPFGKVVPYEESVKVPMIVRDPTLRPATSPLESQALVENVDIAPTIAERAGIAWHADGLSLVPLIDGSATKIRDAALLENCMTNQGTKCWRDQQHRAIPPFVGVVTDRYKYVEYATGEKELYDLSADPYELVNHAGDPTWATTQAALASQLGALRARPEPDTTIVTGPHGVVAPGPQTFTYFTQAFDASYQCRLSTAVDPGTWSACDGQSTTLGPLGGGVYTFQVAGIDHLVADQTPAERTFTVDGSIPIISVGDGSVGESADDAHRFVSFPVSISEPSVDQITVAYETTDVNAQSPADFAAQSGTAVIAAGETSTNVTVQVADDQLHEADETFRLHLREPVGATLGRNTATGTIVDNDAVPTVSVLPATTVEGTKMTGDHIGSVLSFPIELSGPSGLLVSVHYATASGTAQGGSDFIAVSDAIPIAPGQTRVFVRVSVIGDTLHEADETLSLLLAKPVVGATFGTKLAIGTIVDDDP